MSPSSANSLVGLKPTLGMVSRRGIIPIAMSQDTAGPMARETGAPVYDDQHSRTAGPRGPVTLEDVHLIEKLAHFNRERIPERVVHAKGTGAYGYFEVTHDVTRYTRAAFLSEIGKRTEVFVRFSTVGGEQGSADTERDPRGFAVKFYTEEGNYDLVGNNTPVFFIRDPLKFPDFIHTQKRHPQTHLKDPNMMWDFWSLTPESMHQVLILFSNRGTPYGYRHMHGFGSHTFSWINEDGQVVWVKYHFLTDQGIRNFRRHEAVDMAGRDPDFATRDLFDAIERKEYPSWTLYVQIMPFEDAERYTFDPFDVTKVWLHGDYPLIPVGKLVLNRNPQNYFAEVEQAAFSPAHVVPGIGFSPDKMLQGRLFAYGDAHRYRLGANYNLLPVNRPHATTAQNYQRDGAMRFDDNGGPSPNYYPNRLGHPAPTERARGPEYPVQGLVGHYEYRDRDFYTQPRKLYHVMPEQERADLADNLAASLRQVDREIVERQMVHFEQIDADLARRVSEALRKG
ncbi:catalase [Alicyclobacillus acidocaldarius]|uniref:catalase n=1 Tax=Alicyclobacillus acidocaldarius TaxID=405212 RepID=UPI00345F0AF3